MSGKKTSYGITKQHGEHLREVLKWLAAQPDATPLEIGVLEEITGRVEHRALEGSIFRVRLKNRGDAARRTTNPTHMPGKEPEIEWSIDEMDQLRRLVREGKTRTEIAEEIEGRSYYAVIAKMHRLNLQTLASAKTISDHNVEARHRNDVLERGSILARARALRERRIAEGRIEREVA
jgi:hypothetical protein